MNLRKLLGVGLLACSVMPTDTVEARPPYRPLLGRPGGLFDPCGMPGAPCHAPLPVEPCGVCATPIVQPVQQPVFQTQLRPVAETTYQPRQVVTYQTVPQIQYQRQAVMQNVPVTSYQNVTVDEGGYQMVWVPRPVTKTVAQTVLQPQIKYQDVAVQVNQQVAQVQTQLVPQQVVRYVPETRQVGMQYVGQQVIGWQPSGLPMVAAPIVSGAPLTAGLPAYGVPGGPIPDAAERPVPNPNYMGTPGGNTTPHAGDWQTIQQRQTTEPAAAAPRSSATPTAATVWQSQLQSESVAR